MDNRNVGFLIIGISIAVGFIILMFNLGLKKIVSQTCTHGPLCPMYNTIAIQTWISLGIALIIFVIGIVIMFTKPKERVVVRKVKEKRKKLNLKNLDKDEKKVIELLLKEGKAMFQSDLMEKTGMGKVKTTRLLDKLEAKQLVERKRRGMNNIVVLKD